MISVSSKEWTKVSLNHTYISPVVIATPYSKVTTAPPVALRVKQASGNVFKVIAVRLDNKTDPVTVDVSVVVVEAGVNTVAEHGVKMEAHRFICEQTSTKSNWIAEKRGYVNSYTKPVVVGQVMTANDSGWSVFWDMSGSSNRERPNPQGLYIGRHVGEDPDEARSKELIGYIVIEAGSGKIGGIAYTAGINPKSGSTEREGKTFSHSNVCCTFPRRHGWRRRRLGRALRSEPAHSKFPDIRGRGGSA